MPSKHKFQDADDFCGRHQRLILKLFTNSILAEHWFFIRFKDSSRAIHGVAYTRRFHADFTRERVRLETLERVFGSQCCKWFVCVCVCPLECVHVTVISWNCSLTEIFTRLKKKVTNSFISLCCLLCKSIIIYISYIYKTLEGAWFYYNNCIIGIQKYEQSWNLFALNVHVYDLVEVNHLEH